MILSAQLKHIDFREQQIALLDREIAERMHSSEEDLELLDAITRIGLKSAQEILAAIGIDMSRFPTESLISSWAYLSGIDPPPVQKVDEEAFYAYSL